MSHVISSILLFVVLSSEAPSLRSSMLVLKLSLIMRIFGRFRIVDLSLMKGIEVQLETM
jgi:hypothetical protein